jgi:hypothetical protein
LDWRVWQPFGYPCSSLSHDEMQQVVNQADKKFKRAKGKSWMPQITKHDVTKLLQDLPRDNDGLLSFHDIQRRISQVGCAHDPDPCRRWTQRCDPAVSVWWVCRPCPCW